MTTMDQLSKLVDWQNGIVAPDIHFDDDIYQVEAERIFNRAWLVVGHEQMVPSPGSYVTNYMGEVPVIVSRDKNDKISVLVNKCAHRGAQVCLFDRGKTRGFVCSYHGWSYGLDGALNGIPMEQAGFPDGVDKSHLGLERVAKMANFHGLLFASFDPNAPSLEDWLGEELCWFLENFVLSVPVGGLELLPGFHRYQSPGNWKLLAENFIGDSYHIFHTHVAWLALCQEFAERGIFTPITTFPMAPGSTLYELTTGRNRHAPFGAGMAIADDMAFKNDYEEAQRLGPEAAEWVEHRYRRLQEVSKDLPVKLYSFMNGAIFPNLCLMGFVSPLIARMFLSFHPRGVRANECWQWTMVEREAPQAVKDIGIARAMHAQNMGGIITPDDVEAFERIVEASSTPRSWKVPYSLQMQLGHEADGPAGLPVQLGSTPSEANQRNFYRFWLQMMERS